MYGKQTTVFDSDLYSSLFTQDKMREIWSDDNLLRCWLRFEAAVARVQSELGIIPEQAAVEIEQTCREIQIDWPAAGNTNGRHGDKAADRSDLRQRNTAGQSVSALGMHHSGFTRLRHGDEIAANAAVIA